MANKTIDEEYREALARSPLMTLKLMPGDLISAVTVTGKDLFTVLSEVERASSKEVIQRIRTYYGEYSDFSTALTLSDANVDYRCVDFFELYALKQYGYNHLVEVYSMQQQRRLLYPVELLALFGHLKHKNDLNVFFEEIDSDVHKRFSTKRIETIFG